MNYKVYDHHMNLICEGYNKAEAVAKANAYMLSLNPDTTEFPQLRMYRMVDGYSHRVANF
jgi:hypothetical protein